MNCKTPTPFSLTGLKLETRRVEELSRLVNPFNPTKRTIDRSLKALAEDIKQHGVLSPIMIGRDNVIGDGHRRCAAAEIAGREFVPVLVNTQYTGSEIFRTTNNDKVVMKMTADQYLETYVASGFTMDLIPVGSTAEKKINEVNRWVDRQTIVALVERGKSATYVTQLVSLLEYLPTSHELHPTTQNMDRIVRHMLKGGSKTDMKTWRRMRNAQEITHEEFVRRVENSMEGWKDQS